MAHSFPNRHGRHARHMSNTPSPLRYGFTVEISEDSSNDDDPVVTPTRAMYPLGTLKSSTVNRRASGERATSGGYKRGIDETSPTRKENRDSHYSGDRTSLQRTDASSTPVKSLADSPSITLSPEPARSVQSRAKLFEMAGTQQSVSTDLKHSTSKSKQNYSIGIGRSDSRRAPANPHSHRHTKSEATITSNPATAILDSEDLEKLGSSSTSQLRDLSKLSKQDEKGFAITSPDQEVVGMHGRRRLQRQGKTMSRPPGYGGKIWMDQQRQFLQAYEYLCHIGEAKDWIEDVIGKPIPPIVQLEEALRDGVTLAEIVQTLKPERSYRIFRNAKLQYRHSDNIAIFFRFLAEVELPDLFRFELVDLYEKKNIPKVIYCIHALSWILLKQGLVDFRIGNLVGQLQFEDHELEATQKGLDKAGIAMPNFSGMSDTFGAEPEPEPEPVETEEERIDRELQENQASILDFQTQIRGALLRTRLGDTMEQFWSHENSVIKLQSFMRAYVARQRSSYHLQMYNFALHLQNHARGYLLRDSLNQKQNHWESHGEDIVRLQSLFRGRRARAETQTIRHHMRSFESGVRTLQSMVRGAAVRQQRASQQQHWEDNETSVVTVQRLIRGRKARLETQTISSFLQTQEQGIRQLQSLIRASVIRRREAEREWEVQQSDENVLELQSQIRGHLARREVASKLAKLEQLDPQILNLQCLARGSLARQQFKEFKDELQSHTATIAQLQSQLRAVAVRNDVSDLLEALNAEEEAVCEFQTAVRGFMTRKRYAEKKQYYEENVRKVIKVQSYIRARQQGEAYKTLTRGKDPPANTIKNFAHLLNDSDFDFEEEVEIKKLRESVRQLLAENEQREQFIEELDTKIGLLARNKIERDEVAKLTKHIGNTAFRRGASLRETFNVKTLNKDARAKLDQYEELLFVLQTQSKYLARLFLALPVRAAPEGDYKNVDNLVFNLFGQLHQSREEYYYLRLIAATIQEEQQNSPSQDLLRGSHFYNRLVLRFVRGHSDRKFLRHMSTKFVQDTIIKNTELDLESDPLKIYRASINNEQLRTGRHSQRPLDVPPEIAIKDPETRQIFIQNLQDLRDVVDVFLFTMESCLHNMPYGIRYIAQQMYKSLKTSLTSQEDEQGVLQLLGQWLWRSYFKPAFEESEMALDQGLNQFQRNNKRIFLEVMGQIIAGRPFDSQPFLQPLTTYVQSEAMPAMLGFWAEMINVSSIDDHYDIDPISDMHAKQKPTLTIKAAHIFDLHEVVANEVASICGGTQDLVLRQILQDLGNVKANRASMSSSSGEISLSLGTKAHLLEDPDADVKSLFMETKRCILYIVRIQQGTSLMDIMLKQVSPQDEEAWSSLVQEELTGAGGERAAYSECAQRLDDLASMSYRQLKAVALQNIVVLEQHGRLSRDNLYQDLLNDIAVDIRHRNKRRVQRRRELEAIRSTEQSLLEKAEYLDDKLKTYNDTFEQNLNVLQKQRRKKQFLMPFSKQYNHQKELERSGRMPRYGSFKYSAQTLWDKGILMSWGSLAHQGADLTISSDEVNFFTLEGSTGSMMVPGASATFTWDDLLEAQYEDKKQLKFFTGDNTLVVNREAFMAQVSKKFWKTE